MELLHFDISEFDSPDEIGSGKHMDETFLRMLDDARGIAGVPFRITSGYRTPSHNAYVGGVQAGLKSKGSSHLFGYAADIACASGQDREIIVSALIKAGFRRLGIAKTFIHCDNDPDKVNSIWLYN